MRSNKGENNPNWKGGISATSKVRYKNNFRERYPAKAMAQDMVKNALKKGELKRQPCEICNEPKTHAHHDDYSKPLSVRWLCRTHHLEWHKHNTPIYRESKESRAYMIKRSLFAKRCSFCEKSQYEVNVLISGPQVYICNECIDICVEVVSGRMGR